MDEQNNLTTPNNSVPQATKRPLIQQKKFWIIVASVLVIAGIATAAVLLRKPEVSTQQNDNGRTNNVINIPNPSYKPEQPSFNPSPVACPQNTIEEKGEIKTTADIILYTTECVVKVYANNSRDSVIRFYVRDAQGSFNRKIYEVFNRAEFGGSTYAQLFGDKIKINRVTGSHDSKVIDVFGKEVSGDLPETKIADGISRISYSPDKRYLVTDYYADRQSGDKVDVKDSQTGKIKSYDFSQTGLNGAYSTAWSSDSKTLYVAGGIWEFFAPAKLWALDVEKQTVREFAGLDKFSFPVLIFPEQNIVMLSNHGEFPAEKAINVDLYSMDLQTESKTFIMREKAFWAFSTTLPIGDSIIYDMSQEDNKQEIKKVGLKEAAPKVLYKGSVRLYPYIIDGEWVLVNNNGKFTLLSSKTNEEKIFGSGSGQIGFAVPTDGKEYFWEVVGVIDSTSNSNILYFKHFILKLINIKPEMFVNPKTKITLPGGYNSQIERFYVIFKAEKS